MPQIGPLEILIVGVLALMVFGPEKLPGMARSVGKTLNQLKKMASEAKSEFDMDLKTTEANKEAETAGPEVSSGDVADVAPAPASESPSSATAQVPLEVPQPSSKEPVLTSRS